MSKAALSGKYAAYTEYKDSGVEWLGEIPSHWKVKKIKHFGRVLGGFAFKSGDFIKQGYPVIKITNVSHLVMSFNEQAYLPEKFAHENAEYIAQPNSLIFAMTRPIIAGGIKVAKMPKLEKMPLINQRVGFLKIEDKDITDYILFSSLSNSFIAQFKNNMTITNQPNISSEGIESVSLPFPPKNELEKIVTFLDHETAKIDTLIEKQQKLIELLKEKRQAVISHAVTKGLNPDAPMKDSGVEWLGEVPEHWKITSLKYHSDLIDGDRGSNYPNDKDYTIEGIPFFSSKNIFNYKLTDNNVNYISPEKFQLLGKGKLEHNDLIITVRGTIGHVAIFDSNFIGCETGFINAQMMIIRPKSLLSEFILFLSQSDLWSHQLDLYSYGSTVKQLSNEVIGNFTFPLPPKLEIEQISNHVMNIDKTYKHLISKAETQIRLMQERRTALISAAVTGKIDVRNWVAPTTSSDTNEAQQEVTA